MPAYNALDLRWGWKIDHHFELSFTVENALDPRHLEVGPAATGSMIARSAFFRVVWRQ